MPTDPSTSAARPEWPITTEADPDRVYCSSPICGGVDVHPHYHRHPVGAAMRKAIEGYQRDASTALASLRQYLDSGGAEADWLHAFMSHSVAANANADKIKREMGW